MFRIVLVSKPLVTSPLLEMPSENQNVDVLLDHLCRDAQESGELEFVIEGFGRRWPVDIGTDFEIFLEQLPALRDSLDRQIPETFQLRFYEQGIDSGLLIARNNDDLAIECLCWGAWLPNPTVETVAMPVFEQMINDVAETFVDYVERRYPQAYLSSVFQSWRDSVRRRNSNVSPA